MQPGDTPDSPSSTPGPGRTRYPVMVGALVYALGWLVALVSFASWVMGWLS